MRVYLCKLLVFGVDFSAARLGSVSPTVHNLLTAVNNALKEPIMAEAGLVARAAGGGCGGPIVPLAAADR